MNTGLISQRSFCITERRCRGCTARHVICDQQRAAARSEQCRTGEVRPTTLCERTLGSLVQAVGPVLIVLFAFALVHLSGATQRLAGWMTFFGATILMTVSLIEITFYFGALNPEPAVMPSVGLRLIYAVQHLYFIVAAPTLFLPPGIVLLNSRVLPRIFGHLALILATVFAA